MASHTGHDHPNTKAARAACRKGRPQPKLKRKPDMEAGGAKVYEVQEDVISRVERGANGNSALELARVILAKPENYHPDDVRRARQYLFGK